MEFGCLLLDDLVGLVKSLFIGLKCVKLMD